MTNVINLFPRPPSGGKNPHLTLLRHCIETAQLAGYEPNLSLSLLCDLLESAPRGNKDLADDAWAARSFCWRCIVRIEERVDKGELHENAIIRLIDFWTKSFAAREAALRNSVLSELKLLAETVPGQSGKHPAVLHAETNPLKMGIDRF